MTGFGRAARPHSLQERTRNALRRGLALVIGTSLALLVAELVARFCLDPLPEVDFFHRVTIADHDTVWRFRPLLDDAWPHPERARRRHVPFRTNAAGLRERTFRSEGTGEPLVIACMGDSSTAGYGVADDEHYPYLTGERLAPHVARPLHVLNFGVIGFTSRQGLAQFDRYVTRETPAIVTIAFGYNDGYVTRSDQERLHEAVPWRGFESFHDTLQRRSLLYHHVWSSLFPERAHPRAAPRVDRRAFRANLEALIDRVRSIGALPVVIDLAVPSAYLRDATRDVARQRDVPYLCARDVLLREAHRTQVEPFLPDVFEGEGGLPWIRLRWDKTLDPVLVTTDLQQPRRSFTLVDLRDDGLAGDERAGDGLFTVTFPLPPDTAELEFAITSRANLQATPEHPSHILYRRLRLARGHGFDPAPWTAESWLATLAPFLLEGDLGHPNAHGQGLIADALAAQLVLLLPQLER